MKRPTIIWIVWYRFPHNDGWRLHSAHTTRAEAEWAAKDARTSAMSPKTKITRQTAEVSA